MSKIKKKVVTIEYEDFCMYPSRFIDYTLEDGAHVYVARGHVTTKEEGNKLFLTLKTKHKVKKISSKTVEIGLEEEIKSYEAAIDPYTCYIDSYKQEQEAIKDNERLYKIINALRGRK
jgi:hypothetical protein